MERLPIKCQLWADNRKIAIAEENGKKYTLNNSSGFRLKMYQVDGCVPQGVQEKRCDKLVLVEQAPPTAYFVELKGSAVIEALKQLNASITFLKPELPHYAIRARVVASKDVPALKISIPYRQLLQLLEDEKHFKYATNGQYSETI